MLLCVGVDRGGVIMCHLSRNVCSKLGLEGGRLATGTLNNNVWQKKLRVCKTSNGKQDANLMPKIPSRSHDLESNILDY